MPRAAMDYSKTNIYKIVCNDLTVKDCYVGHTTDITKRKWEHKSVCNSEKNKGHNRKIYQIIRENGGWENWNMVLVEKFPCKDKYEACKREREVYEELDAKMNTYRPYATQEERKQYREEHKEVLAEKHKQYYQEHKTELNEKMKQYHEEHKAEYKQYQKQWREEHKEYKKQHDRQYNQEHKAEIAEKRKQYYQEHKAQISEYDKQYRLEHKEKIAEKNKAKIECKYCAKLITKSNMSSHIKRCKSKE